MIKRAVCVGMMFMLSAVALSRADPGIGLQKAADGVTFRHGSAATQIQVWGDRLIRVRYAASGRFTDPAVSAVAGKPKETPFTVIDGTGHVGVTTSAVEVRVDRQTGAVSFLDVATGKPFLTEVANGKSSVTTRVGSKTIKGPAQEFVRQEGEAIIGLGQHPDGKFNYVDTRVRLLQENTKIGVPVLTSSAGYTLLWDNPAVTDIDLAKTSVKWASEYGETSDYYVSYGPDLNQAIAGYRTLTGAAPMFGRWVWGLWQCRERYVKQEELLAVAREYRERQIPIDGIIQDWQYWFPQPWGSHAFGTNFPSPASTVEQLHAANFHTLISVWPKFDQGSRNYEEMDKAGNLYPPIYPNVHPAGNAKWYDPFKLEAREMYWRQINEQIAAQGWDGWWLDGTEPELGGRWGELRELQTGAGPGYAVFNAYPLMTTTAVHDGQKTTRPEQRSIILTRSAYAGQQRNGAIAWSGDIIGSWEVFGKQIPAGLNFVASGLPYWNTDTGGFFGGDPKDPEYRELFTRWFQFSTFCPMLRVHGTGPHKALWLWGDETNKTLLVYDQLRYRLLPYIYSTSWQVTSNGASMMRPLMIDYPTDPKTHDVPDQYLFGPGVMACPVTVSVGGSLAVIPSASLVDSNGKAGGLSAVYYQGKNFDKEVARRVDAAIDFDWDKAKREGVGANSRKDPIPGLIMDGFSVRWEGFIKTQQAGKYAFRLRGDDGYRVWINGKIVMQDWNSRSALVSIAEVDLPADTQVPVKIEYFQDTYDAQIDLRWQPPTGEAHKAFSRKVYLPQGQWYDFWTGQNLAGSRTIDAPAPIDKLPLYIKAGTILPMGPLVQYSGEKLTAPLDLRVYPGADGTFTLYDDAGDGYGYEKGEYATIPLTWDEKAGTLTIGTRTGTYPGMSTNRQFKVVFVDKDSGVGPDEAPKSARVIDYNGASTSIARPQ